MAAVASTGVAERILEFIGVLRQNDFSISIAESQDALRVAHLIGISKPRRLQAALRAALAKSPHEARVFSELFSLYFNWGEAAASMQGQDEGEQHQQSQEQIVAATQAKTRLNIDQLGLQGLARQIAVGDRAGIEIALRQAAEQVGMQALQNFWQEGFFSYRILQQLDQQQGREFVRQAAQERLRHGDQVAADYLEQQIAAFEDQVRLFVRRELRQRDLLVMQRFRRNQLLDRNFYRASADELAEIRREVERMARRLKQRIARRRRRNRRGHLHLQATIRANVQTNLTPFYLRRRRRKKNKPELVVWFDLSESVRAVSEFMLMFVYSLQELFQKVRSFGFVADTVELTELFRGQSFEQSFAQIMSARVINIYRHSDYGEALRQLWTKYGDAVRQQTVLIVLGDARSNYQAHEPELWAQIARRAKYSLWLNPEPRNNWGLGDSVMQDYQKYVHGTATVANLRQLEDVVESLVRRLW